MGHLPNNPKVIWRLLNSAKEMRMNNRSGGPTKKFLFIVNVDILCLIKRATWQKLCLPRNQMNTEPKQEKFQKKFQIKYKIFHSTRPNFPFQRRLVALRRAHFHLVKFRISIFHFLSYQTWDDVEERHATETRQQPAASTKIWKKLCDHNSQVW